MLAGAITIGPISGGVFNPAVGKVEGSSVVDTVRYEFTDRDYGRSLVVGVLGKKLPIC